MVRLKVTSLFSGAGGLDLGIHLAGHEPLLFCDSDPGARQATELLIAGFPCIDVSRAGLRRGLDGQSTGLVRHVFRLLREAKEAGTAVPWVLLENVEALLDRHGGEPPVMQYVVRQLQELGYGSVAWRVVNSAGFGLPNRRKRVFILASLHGDARDVLLTQGSQRCPGSCTRLFEGARCYHCHVSHLLTQADRDEVSYALDLGNAQSQAGEDVVPTFTTSNDRMLLLLSSGQSGMLRIEDAERLQEEAGGGRPSHLLLGLAEGELRGFPEGYTAPCWPLQQPGIGSHRSVRVKDNETELAASKRWDLLGNAVTVPVARWLGERLASPYCYKYHGVGTSDRRMDHLLDEGHDTKSRQAAMGGGVHRDAPNLWSFVVADQLQQALVFPFQPHQGPTAAAAAEGPGSPDPDPAAVLTAGPADPAGRAAAVQQPAPPARAAGAAAAGQVTRAGGGGSSNGSGGASGSKRSGSNGRRQSKCRSRHRAKRGSGPVEAPAGGAAAEAGALGAGGAAGGATHAERDPGGTLGTAGSEAMPGMLAGAGGVPENDEERAAAVADTLMAEIEQDVPLVAPGREESDEGEGGRRGTLATMRHMFQGELVHKTSLPPPGTWDRDSWPRCGWWLAGLGCFAVEGLSDVPVPTPFQPLASFITQVGRPGKPEEVESYLHRLKERGFEVSPTIEKALKTGVRVCKQAQEITRIPDLLSDADMIGGLVWAEDPVSGLWWPAEVLDPYNMPKGRMLPEACEERLSAIERVASLPWLASKSQHAVSPVHVHVVVAFLPVGGSQWVWQRAEQLQDFEAHCQKMEASMRAALRDPKNGKYAEPMRQALQDAKASLAIKKGKHGVDVERMRRTRAAAAAASVNLKQRCGTCRTCMNKYANQRRYECLTQRMKAAALSGHAGAQVAILGEDAVGARVSVWWDGDQTSYEGHIAHFDAVSTEHTVCYDDGEVGMHRLWQHDERIRVLSSVAMWPRDAILIRDRLGTAREEMEGRKRQRREVHVTAAAAAAEAAAPATDYERQRQHIIERNRRAFDLMVGVPARALMQEQGQLQEEEEEGAAGHNGRGHSCTAEGAEPPPAQPQQQQFKEQHDLFPKTQGLSPAAGPVAAPHGMPRWERSPGVALPGPQWARAQRAQRAKAAKAAAAAVASQHEQGLAHAKPSKKRKQRAPGSASAAAPGGRLARSAAGNPGTPATAEAAAEGLQQDQCPSAQHTTDRANSTAKREGSAEGGILPVIYDMTACQEEAEEGEDGAAVPVLPTPPSLAPAVEVFGAAGTAGPAAPAGVAGPLVAGTAAPATAQVPGGSPRTLRLRLRTCDAATPPSPRAPAAAARDAAVNAAAMAATRAAGACPPAPTTVASIAAGSGGQAVAAEGPRGEHGIAPSRCTGPRSPRRPAKALPALPVATPLASSFPASGCWEHTTRQGVFGLGGAPGSAGRASSPAAGGISEPVPGACRGQEARAGGSGSGGSPPPAVPDTPQQQPSEDSAAAQA
ncbi:hypothetical protein N2152v2_002041 [Parachlorella kessleri]